MFRHAFEVLDQADCLHGAKDPPGWIQFPPAEPLPHGGWVVVVVVVPTFTKGDDRQEEVVPGIILGLEIPPAPDMGKRVDRVRAVVTQDGGDKEAPNQSLASSQAKIGKESRSQIPGSQHEEGRGDRRDMVVAVQPDQLGELHPVSHQTNANGCSFLAEKPAAVGFPESVLLGGVRVQMRVGMRVVITMVGRPPDRSTLNGRSPQKSHEKLNRTAGAECLVTEVPVVKTSNGKHANDVHPNAQRQSGPREPHPENRHTRNMQKDVGDRFYPPNAPLGDVWFMVRFFNEMISHRVAC